MSENRHPAGTSVGGQWARGSASEIDLDDDGDLAPDDRQVIDPEVAVTFPPFRHFDDVAAIADLGDEADEDDYDSASQALADQAHLMRSRHAQIDPDSLSDLDDLYTSVSDSDDLSQQFADYQRLHHRIYGNPGQRLERERQVAAQAIKRLPDEDEHEGILAAEHGRLDDEDLEAVDEGMTDRMERAAAVHRERDPVGYHLDYRDYYRRATGATDMKTKIRIYRALRDKLRRGMI